MSEKLPSPATSKPAGGPRQEAIVRALRQAIVSGRYRPRERLIEADVARDLGVSRASLREASRQLIAEGLLVSVHHRGTFVVEFSERDLREIYGLRLALETYAVETLCDEAKPEQLEGLRELVREMKRPFSPTDIKSRVDLDLRFHEELCRASGNSRLRAVWSQIAGQLRSYFSTDYRVGEEPGLLETHQALLACIESRSKEAAVRNLRQHILDTAERVLRSGLLRFDSGSPGDGSR